MSSPKRYDFLLIFIYHFLEKLIPSSEIECFVSFPDVDDNALALFLEIIKGPNVPKQLVWLVSDERLALTRLKQFAVGEHRLPHVVIKKNSLRGLWKFLRARRVYFTHGHYRFVRRSASGRKLINLWHGMPIKVVGALDPRFGGHIHASDMAFASSQFFQDIMARVLGLSKNKVLITGLPRCDQLLGRTAVALAARESLCAPNKNLVVWMPTYVFSVTGEIRADSLLSKAEFLEHFMSALSKLSTIAEQAGCVVLVKLHPMDYLNLELLPDPPSIRILRVGDPPIFDCPLYEFLAVTDGLITDISSVCFDYMSTRRPILITRDLLENYARNLTFPIEKLMTKVFTSVDWNGAESFFRAVVSGEQASFNAYSDFCVYSDALSARRTIDAVCATGR